MSDRPKVVEYLGLPGIGKTWQLGSDGYCAQVGATPHAVPQGRGADKVANTLRGVVRSPLLVFRLLWSSILNWRALPLLTSVRPVLVVPERIARIDRLRKAHPERDVHVDEGGLQFIWRSFSQMDPTESNRRLMRHCLAAYPDLSELCIAYVSCPESQHRHQVKARGKRSQFDLAVMRGDEQQYRRARMWMATLLHLARGYRLEIRYVRPH